MKVLSFTGGSVQGVGLAAIGSGIMETYKPDVIIGTSVSAVFAIPLAMRKTELIKNAMLGFNQKDIFGKYAPLNEKNTFPSFRGFLRVIALKDSLGKQDNLIDFVKGFLTKEMFAEWQNGDYANVLVATTNYSTGEINYFDLRSYKYENALDVILASCNIPVLINGIKLGNSYHYDGGVISAQSGKDFLKDHQFSIREWRSVWARPKFLRPEIYKVFKPTNVAQVASRSLRLMIANESFESEYLEGLICRVNEIEHRKYFFKTELDSLYDTDLNERILDWENGLRIGRK